ncbi:hypothetical protein RND71_006015 [Anisodus tanguticus]|uniref:PORR domain-containing protein n=1 Tax=Anisodus tanguticus TaxID=243964 RepID=A0AAE1VM29_9SOLA|nr:hypothetical protein RND71_006015 [Anisodus tanguticus]
MNASSIQFPNVYKLVDSDVAEPKNQQRIRDHVYDDYMEVEKKTRKVTKFQELLLSQPNSMIAISRLDMLARRFGFKQYEAGKFIFKFPHVFEYIEVVEKDLRVAVCAVESVREREYREKGGKEENVRFSFRVNFPRGFKIGIYYKIAVWKWQMLPYEDFSGYDLRSLEAQKRMEKRAVATIHELLSLTYEKKITLERIAHFRLAMDLPKKLKDFLLQHQGIFYILTRGNQGKLHMVFLREAYKKGELIEPNDLYLARKRLAELGDNDEIADVRRDYIENGGDQETVREDVREESMDSDDDCSVGSEFEYTHEEVNNDDVTDVLDIRSSFIANEFSSRPPATEIKLQRTIKQCRSYKCDRLIGPTEEISKLNEEVIRLQDLVSSFCTSFQSLYRYV